MKVLIKRVETMGLEPTTPCLQIRPTRKVANTDERLRLVRGAIRTTADQGERPRSLPFCYRVTLLGAPALFAEYFDVDLQRPIHGDRPFVAREQDQAAFNRGSSNQRVVHRAACDSQIRESR
jgi:hypothetical protein